MPTKRGSLSRLLVGFAIVGPALRFLRAAQCRRNTPSTARSSAGLIGLECATVTEYDGPSSFSCQKRRKFRKAPGGFEQVVVLPRHRSAATAVVRHPIEISAPSSDRSHYLFRTSSETTPDPRDHANLLEGAHSSKAASCERATPARRCTSASRECDAI